MLDSAIAAALPPHHLFVPKRGPGGRSVIIDAAAMPAGLPAPHLCFSYPSVLSIAIIGIAGRGRYGKLEVARFMAGRATRVGGPRSGGVRRVARARALTLVGQPCPLGLMRARHRSPAERVSWGHPEAARSPWPPPRSLAARSILRTCSVAHASQHVAQWNCIFLRPAHRRLNFRSTS